MQKIQIGKAPDYCLMRGLEIINYRCRLSGTVKGEEFCSRMVSDRSLLMLAKKLRQQIPGNLQSIKPKADLDEATSTILNLDYSPKDCELSVSFLFPSEMLDGQILDMIEVCSKYLQVPL